MFAVGIGLTDDRELQAIASSRDKVSKLSGFDKLRAELKKLTKVICRKYFHKLFLRLLTYLFMNNPIIGYSHVTFVFLHFLKMLLTTQRSESGLSRAKWAYKLCAHSQYKDSPVQLRQLISLHFIAESYMV